jgi:hypothetical protein
VGVTTPHLSDDLYVQYTRVVTPHAFITSGVAVSFAGSGLKELARGQAHTWVGALANFIVVF